MSENEYIHLSILCVAVFGIILTIIGIYRVCSSKDHEHRMMIRMNKEGRSIRMIAHEVSIIYDKKISPDDVAKFLGKR